MAKISPGYQYEMDSTKDLLINRAIKFLIDVGMLKVTATIHCIANHAYYRFVFFSKQDLFNIYLFADHYTNR